jgi:hypothetical protein
MRTHLAATAITGAALLALTACSSGAQSVKTAPDKPASTTSATITTAPAATTPAAAKPTIAKVGDTVTVTGDEGLKLAITLKKWLPHGVKSDNEYITPDSGKVWVAGQFEIKNVGTAVYDDSPDNCVQAADAAGQRYDSGYVDSITAGPSMPSDVKLPTGDKALGWVVFEVPKGTTVTKIQYTPNSGFADQTGQWSIK